MTDTQLYHCNGNQLLALFDAGRAWLAYHHLEVNAVNVFPVPDADTGTNMLLTITSAVDTAKQHPTPHAGKMLKQLSQGAMMGARGNSGTILSILMRGFAQALADAETIQASQIKEAATYATKFADETVRTVMVPEAGTILTVATTTAHMLSKAELNNGDTLLATAVAAARIALDETPKQMPLLAEAGVVDSGSLGFVYILEGMLRYMRGEQVEFDQPKTTEATINRELLTTGEDGYGYDVQFLMIGDSLDVSKVQQDISAMGWSPVIYGDAQMIKVHIHVQNPAQPLQYAHQLGVQLDDVVVENMQAQVLRNRATQPVPQSPAVIAGAAGAGFMTILRTYGADIIIDTSASPNDETLLDAVNTLPHDTLFVLPNDIDLLALVVALVEQNTTNKTIIPLNTVTLPAGIAALLAIADAMESEDANTIAQAANSRAEELVTITLQQDDSQWKARLNTNLWRVYEDAEAAILGALQGIELDERELITLYYGAGTNEQHANNLSKTIQRHWAHLATEVIDGGHPTDAYILSIE